ncbi:MAG: enoyl-CoA hydratase/isomerase family protein [Planctomycetota bacterium]|jgi:enoyl-CoA hydratase/carnithine racemase
MTEKPEKTLSLSRGDGTVLIKLSRGVTNPLGMELINELDDALNELESDPDTSSIVLGSANDKFFSIGFDIPEIFPLSRKDFEIFFRAFEKLCLKLYTLPKPTIAAMTGHAIAGGCILALCCDYRIIAQGNKKMGLNEIKLGVPVPHLPDLVLQSLVGTRSARDVMDTGAFYLPEDALQMGMVDEVLPLEDVLERATAKADELGAQPGKAFAAIKRNRVESIEANVLVQREEKVSVFLDCWYSPEARERIEEAMEKF